MHILRIIFKKIFKYFFKKLKALWKKPVILSSREKLIIFLSLSNFEEADIEMEMFYMIKPEHEKRCYAALHF